MNCPRCNTELPDSAIFCVKCGSTIRPASFSYLPAGVPEWPTKVPKNLPYGAGSDLRPAQFGQQEESPAVANSEVASKKSRLGIPAVIGLFILSILIGGGLTFGILYANGQQLSFEPQPTQAPVQLPTQGPSSTPGSLTPATQGNQLPTPTAFQTITSSDLGISMKYPADWVTDPAQKTQNSTYFDIHPQQNIGVFISFERFTSSASAKLSTTGAVNQANLAQIQSAQGIVNFHIIQSSAPQRTIGGVQWDEQDATFNNSNNVSFHVTTIAVQYKKLYYDIFFYAPAPVYDEAIQKYFLPIFNSFKFS